MVESVDESPGRVLAKLKSLVNDDNTIIIIFSDNGAIREQHDLSRQLPEKANQLRAMLHAWRKDVSAKMMPPNKDPLSR